MAQDLASALGAAAKLKAAEPAAVRRRERWESFPPWLQGSLLPVDDDDHSSISGGGAAGGSSASGAAVTTHPAEEAGPALVAQAEHYKEQGNRRFVEATRGGQSAEEAAGLLESAVRWYERGLALFHRLRRVRGNGDGGDDDLEEVRMEPAGSEPVRALCLANLAACYLRMDQPAWAVRAGREALRLRPDNFKAAYRAAQGEMLLGNLEEARALLGSAARQCDSVSPAGVELRKLLAEVERQLQKERETYRDMFGRGSADNSDSGSGGAAAATTAGAGAAPQPSGARLYGDKDDEQKKQAPAVEPAAAFLREFAASIGRDDPESVRSMAVGAKKFGIDLGDPLVQEELTRLRLASKEDERPAATEPPKRQRVERKPLSGGTLLFAVVVVLLYVLWRWSGGTGLLGRVRGGEGDAAGGGGRSDADDSGGSTPDL